MSRFPKAPSDALRVRILRSGSGGNAVLVQAGDCRLLIDAGLPAETILRELPPDGTGGRLDAFLQTHEHDDHARGAPALARATGAAIWANAGTLRAAGPAFAAVRVEVFRTGQAFRIGPMSIEAFPVPHDAAEPVAFALSCGGRRVLIACDLGEATDELVDRARGADLLLLEANYDVRLLAVSAYPWFLKNRILSGYGHLSNDSAARVVTAAAVSGRPQTVCLMHLSEQNNLSSLARDIVRDALEAAGHTHVRVEAVRPNTGTGWW